MTACGEKRGTYAGVNLHRKAWEAPCDECRQAARDYARRRRRDNPAAAEQARRESRIRSRALAVLARRHRREFADILRQMRDAS